MNPHVRSPTNIRKVIARNLSDANCITLSEYVAEMEDRFNFRPISAQLLYKKMERIDKYNAYYFDELLTQLNKNHWISEDYFYDILHSIDKDIEDLLRWQEQ